MGGTGGDSGQGVSEEEEVEGRVKQLARWKGIAEGEREMHDGKEDVGGKQSEMGLKEKRSRRDTFESGECDSNPLKSVNLLTEKR